MQISCVPILRDDETLYSIAARTRLRNAARDDRDACRTLFGPSSSIRIAEYPVNLSLFSEATKRYLGGPREVLIATTLCCFFERIGGPPWRAAKWRRPVETAGYGLATLSNGNVSTWRVCAQCLESDLSTYGTSHWRLSHQLPSAFLCLTHHSLLSESIAPRNDRHIRFLLPEQTTLSTAYGRSDLYSHEGSLVRLTKLGNDALFDDGDTSDLACSHSAIRRALDSRGLLTSKGELRTEEFAAEIGHRYRFLSDIGAFRQSLSSEGVRLLMQSFRRANSWRRPEHNLLLIDWLFGSWSGFRQQCAWQSQMDTTSMMAAEKTRHYWADERLTHRGACLDFMNSRALPLRSEFFVAARRSFQWLLRNDAEWFDLNFPDNRYASLQGSLF